MVQLNVINSEGENTMDKENWFEELTTFENKKEANEIYKIYFVYKYVKKGCNKEAAIKDARWDEPNKGPGMAAAKKILKYFRGDIKEAAKAVLEISKYFDEHFSGPWGLGAVFNRLT